MARESPYRCLRRSIVRSRKLSAVSSDAERIYLRMLAGSDSYGTMLGSAWDVKLAVLPGVDCMTEIDVETGLGELETAKLIVRWDFEGELWAHILDFDEHQQDRFVKTRGHRKSPVPPTGKYSPNSRQYSRQKEEGRGKTEDVATATTKRARSAKPPVAPAAPPLPGLDDSGDELAFEPVAAPTPAPATAGRKPKVSTEQLDELWEHWRSAFGKRAGMVRDDKRTRRMTWGIKTYGLEEAKRAVDGYAGDEWRRVALDRHDLALIFRDAAHVERGHELHDDPKTRSTDRSTTDDTAGRRRSTRADKHRSADATVGS